MDLHAMENKNKLKSQKKLQIVEAMLNHFVKKHGMHDFTRKCIIQKVKMDLAIKETHKYEITLIKNLKINTD